jgi:hypothetical protein
LAFTAGIIGKFPRRQGVDCRLPYGSQNEQHIFDAAQGFAGFRGYSGYIRLSEKRFKLSPHFILEIFSLSRDLDTKAQRDVIGKNEQGRQSKAISRSDREKE